MAQRDGFTIPNYSDTVVGTHGDIAEPDSGDFIILGNHRNGIISGCGFSFASGTLTVPSGDHFVLLDGVPTHFSGSLTTTVAGTGPKFVIIAIQSTGIVQIAGTAGENPVFPNIPDATAVLAAIYVADDGATSCIDKRVLLQNGVHGWTVSGDFLTTRNSSGVKFAIDSSGSLKWGVGVAPELSRSGSSMGFSSSLTVDGAFTASGDISGNNITASAKISGSNLTSGAGEPSGGSPGDIYQRTTGAMYVRESSEWTQVIPFAMPIGSIISHVSGPADSGLIAKGWLPLNGTPRAKADYPELWDAVPASWRTSTAINLPDTTARTFMGASGTAGAMGGSNSITLTTGQLPAHQHADNGATVTSNSAGTHRHTRVDDPPNGGGFVYTHYFGDYQLFRFNGPESARVSNGSIIYVKFGNIGAGTGLTDQQGNHVHQVQVGAMEQSVGNGERITTTPAHMTVYYYIKAT